MRHQDLNPPAIIKTVMSVEEELAQKINEQEEKIVQATLEHVRLQGEDLLRVKKHLGKRKFSPWLKANFRFSRPIAYRYMKVALQWDFICQHGLQIKSLRQVLRLLAGPRKGKKQPGPTPAPQADPSISEPTNRSSQGAERPGASLPSQRQRPTRIAAARSNRAVLAAPAPEL